jgi:exodeoxyribonuclease V
MKEETTDFGVIFEQFFGHELTAEQRELRLSLESFTRDRDPNCLFVLSGYAGTGKTTMLGAYVKALSHFKVKTKLLAPTGRAAKVLSNRSGKEALTVHKQIYRRKDQSDDFSPMNLTPNLHSNTVFIVDEASMIPENTVQNDGQIGRDLLSDLLEYVYTGKNCKLIFLGDEGQLPPVGSSDSPALDPVYLKRMFPRIKVSKFKLISVLRQDQSSGILLNATKLRSTVFPDKYKFETGFPDFIRLSGENLQEELEHCYSNYGAEETIVITRSNKRANQYNQHIRGRILWYEELLCQQDNLMVVKNNYYWLDDDSKAGFIANGELLKVKRIRRYETMYGFEFARVVVQMEDYPDEPEVEVLLLLESIDCEGPSVPRNRLKDLFFEIEKDHLNEKNKRKRYDKILKDPYFNALQVKYAYAVTCHKSQGGQWSAVFIDPGFLTEEMINEDYYRWLYTAITRSTQKVYMLNFPDDDFQTN